MSVNPFDQTGLQPVDARGWRAGFANLFRKEGTDWWRLRTLVLRSLLGLGIVNGITAVVLFTETSMGTAGNQVFADGMEVLFQILALFASIGATLRAQDAIIGDRQLGITAWILSKPVSRVAYVASKFVANAVGVFVTMVLIEGVVGYLELGLIAGRFLPLERFAPGVALLVLAPLFYLALGMMIGVFSNTRGLVIGIPLVLILGYQLIMSVASWSVHIMPWGLPLTVQALVMRQPLPTAIPLVALPLWVIVFLAVAVYGFGRQDL